MRGWKTVDGKWENIRKTDKMAQIEETREGLARNHRGRWLKNETTAGGRRRTETERMSRGAAKYRILVAIPNFNHPVALLWFPVDVLSGAAINPNTQRGNDN